MKTETVPAELLGIPVRGVNLIGETWGEQWGNEATLLVFLRHLG